jgi:hypothetical protein
MSELNQTSQEEAALLALISELTRTSKEGLEDTRTSKELEKRLVALETTIIEMWRHLIDIGKQLINQMESSEAKASKIGRKGRGMKGFGEWLNESKLGLTDVITLRERTRDLEGWEGIKKSDKIGVYIEVLQKIQCAQQASAITTFYKLWSLYEDQERPKPSAASPTGYVVTAIAVLLLAIIGYVLYRAHIEDLGSDQSRAILAFLFGITTVGIVIIVVVAVFFEARETTLDDRFQRGKDILTILIGLLGAILGYYFGQQAGQQQTGQQQTMQKQLADQEKTLQQVLQKLGSQATNPTTPTVPSPQK